MSKFTETLKKPIASALARADDLQHHRWRSRYPCWAELERNARRLIAGFNVAAAFYGYLQMRSCESNNRLIEICTEQQAMLRAFMEDAVKVHFMGMVEEETPPTAPRLH